MTDIITSTLQLWSALLILFAISYMIKRNPLFTFTMQLIVGCMAGNQVVLSLTLVNSSVISPLIGGAWWKLVYIVIGFLLFATFSVKWRWIARYPTAILVGTGIGLVLRSIFITDALSQLQMSMFALTNDPWANFGNIFFIVAMSLTFYYFLFGFELKGLTLIVNKIARGILIFAFGISIGGSYINYSSIALDVMTSLRTYLTSFWIHLF